MCGKKKLPDLQCAWLLLLFYASPRANHAIRTMPPSASAAYARGHDDAIWTTLQNMLGGTGDADAAPARHVAALPGALGGLGLQSAEKAAPAAYWASWADALPAIHARLPRCAVNYVQLLESEAGGGVHCLAEAAHGAIAPPGACSSTALAPHHQWRQVPETGRMVGSSTHRGPLPYTLAIVCSFPPCRPAHVLFSAPKRDRMPEPPYRATRQAASRHRRCKSL